MRAMRLWGFNLGPVAVITVYALAASAHAAAVIYEPFDDADPSLNGNTAGTGLTDTWAADGGLSIASGSLSYGSLPTSGNHVTKTGGTYQDGGAEAGTTLNANGLLADGATLWFSVLDTTFIPESGTQRSYLTLGTGRPDGFDRIGGNSGFGIGYRMQNGNLQPYFWSGSARRGSAVSLTAGVHLVVGKITWAASGSNDLIEIFLPGTDLALPATPVSSMSWDVDQSAFTTLGVAGGDINPAPEMDEIRFGATYEDVIGGGGSPSDYDTWAENYPEADLSDPDADLDGDGATNDEERLFGTDPTEAASVSPIMDGLNLQVSTPSFTYTRRDPSLSGYAYTVWTSTDLVDWFEDTGAVQLPGTPDGLGVQDVEVTLSPGLLSAPARFARVQATPP